MCRVDDQIQEHLIELTDVTNTLGRSANCVETGGMLVSLPSCRRALAASFAASCARSCSISATASARGSILEVPDVAA
jgi:hypothetical protein